MMPRKELVLKNATIYAAYLLIVWGFFRLLFQLPDNITELFVKPVVWLLPLVFILRKEKLGLESVGITLKNFFPTIYFVLGLGALFVLEAVFLNYTKHGGLNFGSNIGSLPFEVAVGLSFATAVSEEISFRGYLFNRVWYVLKSEIWANVLTNTFWVAIHVPLVVFVNKLDLVPALIYLAITAIFGIGSAFVYARTKNVFGSILLHVLWEWPIILFR